MPFPNMKRRTKERERGRRSERGKEKREKAGSDQRYFHPSRRRFNISESSCRKVDRAGGEET